MAGTGANFLDPDQRRGMDRPQLAARQVLGVRLGAGKIYLRIRPVAAHDRQAKDSSLGIYRYRIIWGSLFWTAGILLTNEPQWGLILSLLLGLGIFSTLALISIIYAVLRHRLVDVAVVLDHTLVYGGVTALVIGVIAAVNNLALRATLGEGTGLLLQIVIPLSLGIVLGRVRQYMDMLVERVFFRKRYIATRRLEGFMARCGHIVGTENLLDATVKEVARYSGSPGVSLFQASGGCYRCVASERAIKLPKSLPMEDPAMVEARARHKAVDTAILESELVPDSCIYPINALGVLQGVLVCVNRPGEHYATDEKRLIGRAMRDVGSAWRILQARDNRDFVRDMARGLFSLATAKSKARSLVDAWENG